MMAGLVDDSGYDVVAVSFSTRAGIYRVGQVNGLAANQSGLRVFPHRGGLFPYLYSSTNVRLMQG
jgi:hypothetical protein